MTTLQTPQNTAKNFNKKAGMLFCNLYERWQNEKDYEDINDYLAAIQKLEPNAFRLKKRPFELHIKCQGGAVLFCKIKAAKTSLQIICSY